MLSDKTIYRGNPYSIKNRFLNKIRKLLGKRVRRGLNEHYRELLKGCEISVFSNNCLGSTFLQDANLQYRSPTVNMAFDGEEFIKLLEQLSHYLYSDFRFVPCDEVKYPVAMLDDIELRFVHYRSEEEAVSAWRRRCERIAWDNLFIIATDHDGMGKAELLERFDKLPYRNKLMFTSQSLPQYDWAVTVPQFAGRRQVEIMTLFANIKGERYYEACFRIADWIKACSDGRDASVKSFVR